MTEKKNFESALKQLEDVVNALEAGDMPLENALKAFEQGTALVRYCTTLLDQAEKRVKVLTENSGTGLHTEEWMDDRSESTGEEP